jgi:hypothetical protein
MSDKQIIDRLTNAFAGAGVDSDGRLHSRLAALAERQGLLDVSYRTVDSPLGLLLLAATGEGLVRVAFSSEDHDAVLARLASDISPRILRTPRRLDEAAHQLDEYFAGKRRAFSVPVDLQLAHGFRRSVLEHLRRIPYGATQGGRESVRGPRRRERLLTQPAPAGRAVPPGGAQRRHDGRVSRWARGEARPAGHGVGGVTRRPRQVISS